MRLISRVILCLVIAFSILLLFLHFDLKPLLGDEGILAMDGWRISRGEVPQRDFFQFIPPLAACVQALSFKIFSPSVFSVRILGLLYGIALLVLSYILFRRFLKNDLFAALSLSFIVPFGVGMWYFGSHHWLCDILQVTAALFLLLALEKKSSVMSFLSGLPAGMAVFTLQDQGAYGVIGLFLCAVFVSKDERKLFLLSGLSAVSAFALLSLPFVILAGPSRIFKDWVYFPLFNYKGSGGNQLSPERLLAEFSGFWNPRLLRIAPLYSVSNAISSTFLYLTPVFSILSLGLLWARKVLRKPDLLVLTVYSLAFLFSAFHRIALTNLTWAFLALLPFYILLEYYSTGAEGKPLRVICHATAFVLVLSSLCFSMSRAAICMKKDNLRVLTTQAGSYRLFNPIEKASIQELLDAIDKEITPSEPLFCLGYIPLVNFMSQHPNPTRFNFMFINGYYTREQVLSFRESIDSSGTAWGVSDKSSLSRAMGKDFLPGFTPVFENDIYILWKRDNNLQRNGIEEPSR